MALTLTSALPLGIPALLLLVVLLGCASVVVQRRGRGVTLWSVVTLTHTVGVTSRDEVDAMARLYGSVLGCIATPFWVWAVANTVDGGSLDAGVITLIVVMFGSTSTLITPTVRPWTVRTVVVGAGLVSANYVLGAIVVPLRRPDIPWTLTFYYAVTAVVWGWLCGIGAVILYAVKTEAGPLYARVIVDARDQHDREDDDSDRE
eukprot:m.189031 g.189031  ORF g.189031 m.189031 type:complete len:204 (+) comp24843_c0_seq1:201-812(+)